MAMNDKQIILLGISVVLAEPIDRSSPPTINTAITSNYKLTQAVTTELSTKIEKAVADVFLEDAGIQA